MEVKPVKDSGGNQFYPETSLGAIMGGGELSSALLDILHPVGEYYETSNTSFDPNTTWGGTWYRDTKGLVTVGAVDEVGEDTYPSLQLEVGDTTGEKEHTLTINEMPSHNHGIGSDNESFAAYHTNPVGNSNWEYGGNNHLDGAITITTNTGGGQAHNNVQPSIGVIRWHRVS